MLSQLRKRKNHRGQPVRESTVQHYLSAVSAVLSDAKRNEIIQTNPARMIDLPTTNRMEQHIPTVQEVQRLLQALSMEPRHFRVFYLLAMATGCRRGELCALQWQDIDWEQRSIHICRSAVKITGDEIFVKEPKTRSGDRYVYFSAQMENLLREYRRACLYITTIYDERELDTNDFLFRRQGTRLPMTPTTFTWRFKCILKKNGLPQELNVHSLRHTAASLMIAGGADVATVAGILGHSQPSTTLNIYIHAFDKNKKPPARACRKCWRYDIV